VILDWLLRSVHNDSDSECEPARYCTTGAPARRHGMLEILTDSWAQIVMLFAAIAILIMTGAYFASKWRGTNEDDRMSTSELLTNFREMHSKSVLSDEEFRTIKSKLAGGIQKELRDTDKPVCDNSNDN